MPEIIFVGYILMFFLFPAPTLALTLGVGAGFFVYRRRIILNNQPGPGKKLLLLHFLSSALNLVLGFALSVSLAGFVYLVIYRSLFLFLFNVIFCTLISLRWFDFTYSLFRKQVMKMLPDAPASLKNARFTMLYGLKPNQGWGVGMTPLFVDAGFLSTDDTGLHFHGVFTRQDFDPEALNEIEKVSNEKLLIVPARKNVDFRPETFLLVLRDRFYPFKSQGIRDTIYASLAVFHTLKKSPVELKPSPLPASPA